MLTRLILAVSLFLASGGACRLGAEVRGKIDMLVADGLVITMDPARRVLDHGAVAVRGDRIVAVGTPAELKARYSPRQTVSAAGSIVLPGLVNTHNHAPMVLFRGIANDLRLMDWLENYIYMATLGGAQALGLEKDIGSLEAGKKADLILVDAEVPAALPLFDPYAKLVYSLKGGAVRTSIINGRLVMRDRGVLTVDEAAVRNKARDYQKKIAASLGR